jgi:hypothetical protein
MHASRRFLLGAEPHHIGSTIVEAGKAMRRAVAFSSIVLLTSTLLSAGTPIRKGTKISVRFQDVISSANAHVGDTVEAVLTRGLDISPELKIPAGATVRGRVTKSQSASPDGTVPGMIAVMLESIGSGDIRYVFATRELVRRGRPVSGKDSRDPNRRKEIENTITDTFGGIAHPDPKNIPGTDGGIHGRVELQSLQGTIPPEMEFVFVTTTDAAVMEKHPTDPGKPEEPRSNKHNSW